MDVIGNLKHDWTNIKLIPTMYSVKRTLLMSGVMGGSIVVAFWIGDIVTSTAVVSIGSIMCGLAIELMYLMNMKLQMHIMFRLHLLVVLLETTTVCLQLHYPNMLVSKLYLMLNLRAV